MDNEERNEKLVAVLKDVLRDDSALSFLRLYGQYCHMIDDLVDEGGTHQQLLKTFAHAAEVFNHPFYLRYQPFLYPMVIAITNDYADSVAWEKNGNEWQMKVADGIRNTANNMIFTVVNLVRGYDAMREISQMVREDSYFRHHDNDGNPI